MEKGVVSKIKLATFQLVFPIVVLYFLTDPNRKLHTLGIQFDVLYTPSVVLHNVCN